MAVAVAQDATGIDVYQQHVADSIVGTLGSFCGEEPVWQGSSSDWEPLTGIAGIISLVGDVRWSLIFAFPEVTAMGLAVKLVGEAVEFDSADMADVVGEVANVVAGDVAARLEPLGVNASLSLPTVTRGRDMSLLSSEHSSCRRLTFNLSDGEFWLLVAVPHLSVRR